MDESATRRKNILLSCAFVLFGGPGILAVYLPAWITRWKVPRIAMEWRFLATLLILAGLLPLGESIARFVWSGRGSLSPTHPTQTLVASGLYRYVRNPMYVGVLAVIAGQAILFQSGPLCLYLAVVAVGFHLFVLLCEEPTLGKKYGSSYDTFLRNVPRWFPRTSPWRQPADTA